uniref:Uncharacterized protein n=1 Tax=Anguilla anguilla TaxID=7936 RepID=A0A0E9SZE9_ANGAN
MSLFASQRQNLLKGLERMRLQTVALCASHFCSLFQIPNQYSCN